MAKHQNVPIGKSDIEEYLKTSSDFAFELRCLETLSSLGFECQHGGSYTDPVTEKTRQFDIRAQKSEERFRVRCAIECKSISDSFPLIVMCVPRAAEESFHELILSYHPDLVKQGYPRILAFDSIYSIQRVDCPPSPYQTAEPVGKSCTQVGKKTDGSVFGTDREVFEKWAQALASVGDLAMEEMWDGKRQNGMFLSLILPVLVIPDGMLWKVEFERGGVRKGEPHQTNRCSFYVGQNYAGTSLPPGEGLVVSHLEITTLTGLKDLVTDILVPGTAWFRAPTKTDQLEKDAV